MTFLVGMESFMATRVKPQLSYIVLSSCLVWRFLGTIGISHLPHCYVSLVTMVTTAK